MGVGDQDTLIRGTLGGRNVLGTCGGETICRWRASLGLRLGFGCVSGMIKQQVVQLSADCHNIASKDRYHRTKKNR